VAERGEEGRGELVLAATDAKAKERFRSMKFVPPSRLFDQDKGLDLVFGGEHVEVFHPGWAHSPDNVVVYFHAQRILFGGCAIMAGARVGNTADADIESWIAALDRLGRFQPELVIPGHGDRVDAGLVDHTRRLLQADKATSIRMANSVWSVRISAA